MPKCTDLPFRAGELRVSYRPKSEDGIWTANVAERLCENCEDRCPSCSPE